MTLEARRNLMLAVGTILCGGMVWVAMQMPDYTPPQPCGYEECPMGHRIDPRDDWCRQCDAPLSGEDRERARQAREQRDERH